MSDFESVGAAEFSKANILGHLRCGWRGGILDELLDDLALSRRLTYNQLAIYYVRAMGRHREDRIFKAVADRTRRSILELLHQRERTVLELCQPFSMTQPSLSKHLAVLRRSGLIAARRCGRHRYYRLAPEPLEQIAAWATQFRELRDPSGHLWRLTQFDT